MNQAHLRSRSKEDKLKQDGALYENYLEQLMLDLKLFKTNSEIIKTENVNSNKTPVLMLNNQDLMIGSLKKDSVSAQLNNVNDMFEKKTRPAYIDKGKSDTIVEKFDFESKKPDVSKFEYICAQIFLILIHLSIVLFSVFSGHIYVKYFIEHDSNSVKILLLLINEIFMVNQLFLIVS